MRTTTHSADSPNPATHNPAAAAAPHTALMRALRLSPDSTLGPRLISAARTAAAMHRAETAAAARNSHPAAPGWDMGSNRHDDPARRTTR